MLRKLIAATMLAFMTLCFVLPLTPAGAALTKTETTQALEWEEIAAQGFRQTGSIDVSTAYSAALHIDCCLSSTAAHTGTEVIVQISSEAGVNDSWTTLTKFTGPAGTGVKSDCNAANVTTRINITNPATGTLDHFGKFIFIEDTAAVANSQICYQITAGADATDFITVLDTPLTTSTDCDVWTVDGEGSGFEAVAMWVVQVPPSASQVRVIFNNNADLGAATVHTRVRVTKTTGL